MARGSVSEFFNARWIGEPNSGCWLWTGRVKGDKRGERYGVGRPPGYNRKEIKAHRLSYILHNGPIPEGLCVCHKCDTPLCVNPAHLFLGTVADNARDMMRKGRKRNTKLAPDLVRQLRGAAGTQAAIAARFNISPATVWLVLHRKTWAHVI